jgi:hypothetical protein
VEQPYSNRNQFNQRWGWYSAIYELAKGDITKFKDITEQDLKTALMAMMYLKEKNDIEKIEMKRNVR